MANKNTNTQAHTRTTTYFQCIFVIAIKIIMNNMRTMRGTVINLLVLIWPRLNLDALRPDHPYSDFIGDSIWIIYLRIFVLTFSITSGNTYGIISNPIALATIQAVWLWILRFIIFSASINGHQKSVFTFSRSKTVQIIKCSFSLKITWKKKKPKQNFKWFHTEYIRRRMHYQRTVQQFHQYMTYLSD